MSEINWSDEAERREFENSIEVHRAIRKNYSWSQWLQWFSGIMLLPFGMVLSFYGPIAWNIVSDVEKEQIEKEERFAEAQGYETYGRGSAQSSQSELPFLANGIFIEKYFFTFCHHFELKATFLVALLLLSLRIIVETQQVKSN